MLGAASGTLGVDSRGAPPALLGVAGADAASARAAAASEPEVAGCDANGLRAAACGAAGADPDVTAGAGPGVKPSGEGMAADGLGVGALVRLMRCCFTSSTRAESAGKLLIGNHSSKPSRQTSES